MDQIKSLKNGQKSRFNFIHRFWSNNEYCLVIFYNLSEITEKKNRHKIRKNEKQSLKDNSEQI